MIILIVSFFVMFAYTILAWANITHPYRWVVVTLSAIVTFLSYIAENQSDTAATWFGLWMIAFFFFILAFLCGRGRHGNAQQPAQPQPTQQQPTQQQPAQPTPQETAAQKIVRLKKEGIFAGLTEEEAFKWAMEESKKTPKVDANQYFVSGKYLLWGFIPVPWATYFFYTKTNKLVLRIPVLFDMKEEYTEFGNWSDVSFCFGPFAGKVEYKPKVWLPQLPGRKSGDALIAVNIPKRIVREIKMNWINR